LKLLPIDSQLWHRFCQSSAPILPGWRPALGLTFACSAKQAIGWPSWRAIA